MFKKNSYIKTMRKLMQKIFGKRQGREVWAEKEIKQMARLGSKLILM